MTDMLDLPRKHFGCIVCDPPWHFKFQSQKGEAGRPQHYARMSLAEIKALPVGDLAAANCFLFLWTTAPMLRRSFEVIDAWGFTYKSMAFDWIKTNPKAPQMFTGIQDWHMGQGYTTRKNAEYCLLATKGRPVRQSKSVRALIVSPRLLHSQKPSEFYRRVEAFCKGPRLDVFSRIDRQNWTAWGNETGSLNRVAA